MLFSSGEGCNEEEEGWARVVLHHLPLSTSLTIRILPILQALLLSFTVSSLVLAMKLRSHQAAAADRAHKAKLCPGVPALRPRVRAAIRRLSMPHYPCQETTHAHLQRPGQRTCRGWGGVNFKRASPRPTSQKRSLRQNPVCQSSPTGRGCVRSARGRTTASVGGGVRSKSSIRLKGGLARRGRHGRAPSGRRGVLD